MMPDLGRYWVEVTASYVIGLAILAALVLLIWRRSRAVKRQLDAIEARRTQGTGRS